MTWPRSWTPTTSGFARASASSAGGSPGRTRPWPTWLWPRRARPWPTAGSAPPASTWASWRPAAPGAYDINAACAGFCYGLASASDAVRAGSARHVLVIGSEKMSAWVDPQDRSTRIIFGGGAGAAVVGPVEDPADEPGIGPVAWGSAGDIADKIVIQDRTSFLFQEGQSVFRWATTELHPTALAAMERAGVEVADLGAFVPHQANLRIIEALARKIGVPRERVADDIKYAGNTSSASIPLALARMTERGELPSGSPVLLMGFGAGMCYAAQVITVP